MHALKVKRLEGRYIVQAQQGVLGRRNLYDHQAVGGKAILQSGQKRLRIVDMLQQAEEANPVIAFVRRQIPDV